MVGEHCVDCGNPETHTDDHLQCFHCAFMAYLFDCKAITISFLNEEYPRCQ